MLVPIKPVTVNKVRCTEVSVSLAVSSSMALRAVPVGPDGVELSDHVLSIVLGPGDPALADLLAAIADLVSPLVEARRAAAGFAKIAREAAVESPPASKEDLDAQARQAMLDAAAALEAAKAAYEAASAEPVR